MKVLVIGSVYPRFEEDAEVPWLRASVAHLKKAGVEIQVLAPAYKGLRSHTIDGTSVNRFRYAPAKWEMLTHEEGAPSKMASKPWLQLLAIPYIISGFFKCIGLCRRWRPDVIHAHWPFPHAYIALGAAKLFGIPLALNFHGAELLLIRKKKWVRPLLKFAIGQAQAVFANSSFTAGKIKAIRSTDVEWSPYGTTLGSAQSKPASAPAEESRMAPHTNAVAGTDPRENAEFEPHPIADKFKILFVGRHIERKGIRYLIEAAKYLPADKFEIRIVGVGDLTDKLKVQANAVKNAAIASANSNDAAENEIGANLSGGDLSGAISNSANTNSAPCNIVFTGKLSPEALEAEYRTANVFTLPAIVDSKGDTEGLGVVLIEAMELGLPIVASNVGGIPDVVVDGMSGILVPEKNPQALADAFKRLAADPALVKLLLAGSRKRIAECFSWDRIIERQIAAYGKILRH